ncbi:protein of unknown function [Paraburkholderia kururiensis]
MAGLGSHVAYDCAQRLFAAGCCWLLIAAGFFRLSVAARRGRSRGPQLFLAAVAGDRLAAAASRGPSDLSVVPVVPAAQKSRVAR